jgi:hypothetical protein
LAAKNIGKQSQMLSETVNSLMRAMLNDFTQQYRRAISNRKAAFEYKQRLMQKLNGFEAQSIIDGYENIVDKKPEFMPTIPELCRSISDVQAVFNRSKREAKALERNALELPKPTTRQCNPMQMLRDALENSGKVSLEQRRREHEALISQHYREGKIKMPVDDSGLDPNRHDCSAGFCTNPGVLSHSVNGSEQWYCQKHIIKTV